MSSSMPTAFPPSYPKIAESMTEEERGVHLGFMREALDMVSFPHPLT
jgi:hypothetical protein